MADERLRHGKGKRIMKPLKLKPYLPQLHQGLLEDIVDKRVEFSVWFVVQCEADHSIRIRVFWTDEASFT